WAIRMVKWVKMLWIIMIQKRLLTVIFLKKVYETRHKTTDNRGSFNCLFINIMLCTCFFISFFWTFKWRVEFFNSIGFFTNPFGNLSVTVFYLSSNQTQSNTNV